MSVECKEQLERLINKEYRRRNPEMKDVPNFVLPTSYGYCRDSETLFLTIKEVLGKMQDDCGAFESWVLAIKNWVTEVNEIVLKWERPENIKDPKYQRFLYRVKKATEVFTWLKIDDICESLIMDLAIIKDSIYLVNEPTQIEKKEAEKSEATYERLFMNEYKETLAKVVGMTNSNFYNQLPCGLFSDNVKESNRIMHGFIDIWGLNEEDKVLNLFELKNPNESPISIISESFFYAVFRKSILDKEFNYESKRRIKNYRGRIDIINSHHEYIKIHLLASKLHSLIDSKMINLINKALEQYNIQFDFIRYSIDPKEPQKIIECKIEY